MEGKDFKILFAEDEPALREITTELLAGEGYVCDAVADGLEARDRLKHEHYDLLITDFNMPRMNGSELLFWCRQNDLHIPVIFVTANIERLPVEEMALADCCSSMLMKPVAIDDLTKAIKRAQDRAHDFDCRKIFVSQNSHFPGQHVRD